MTVKDMNQSMTTMGSYDRASEVMRRIALRNVRQKKERERLKSLSFSICVCVLVTCYIAVVGALGGPGAEDVPVTATSQTPLIFENAGGYVLAGVIGFAVCATLISIFVRKVGRGAPTRRDEGTCKNR